MRAKEFSAVVQIDGKPLEEYDLKISEEGSRIECWIASEEGKSFSIRWTDARTERSATEGIISIDGTTFERPRKMILPSRGEHASPSNWADVACIPTGGGMGRQLQFSSIQLTDDDDYLNNVSSPQFGEISLTLYELRIHSRGDKTDPPPCPQIAGLAAGEAKIYERSKKSGAHRISAGKHEKIMPYDSWNCSRASQTPLVTFIFRYRPLAILQAMDIVHKEPTTSAHEPPQPQREPSPEVEIKDDPEDDASKANAQEIVRLKTRLRELERVQNSRPSKRVKREPNTHANGFVQGEVIDLT